MLKTSDNRIGIWYNRPDSGRYSTILQVMRIVYPNRMPFETLEFSSNRQG